MTGSGDTNRRYTPRDPFTFAQYVEKSYRLYRKGLLTAKEFADVTGENLRNQMNFREDADRLVQP